MKVLAIPLARQRSTAKTYFTYLVHAAKVANEPAPPVNESLMTKMANKASSFWVGLGRTDKKSILDWRRRTFRAGEKVMDHIAYEEWALKGIDHGLGPRLRNVVEGRSKNARDMTPLTIGYPEALVSKEETLESFASLAKVREPYHYRWLVYNMIGIPATAPLFIVPALPNILTYYVVWRAWSHWRAYTASHYLNVLQHQNLIRAGPCDELDTVLQTPPADATKEAANVAPEATTQVDATPEWEVYLHPHQIDDIVHHFQLETQSRVDLRRAREQMAVLIRRAARAQ